MDDKEKQHIREYVTRAKFFIDNINQRRQTMARITQVIVECQHDFLEKGIQSLRPLTRAEVGERIGMHESTVSRATAGKYVLLPAGQVVPFSLFFTASLGTKDVIKNIIDAEDRGHPYSDQEIVEKLRNTHGISSPEGRSQSTARSCRSCRRGCGSAPRRAEAFLRRRAPSVS